MRALDGVMVVDLSHALAGPFCTYHLHLLGADVIKVERPDVGDDFRHYTEHAGLHGMSAPFIAVNAGKRSMTLDLKSEAGRGVLDRLVERGDVLVENFRPGITDRLGIGYEALHKRNPKLIYCSITGFGQTGTLRNWTAYDHIVQAMSGVMSVNGSPDGDPMKVAGPGVDIFAGFLAHSAIVASLLRRERSGSGQYLDVGMLDAAMVMMTPTVGSYLVSGIPPRRSGNRGFRMVVTSDTYRTQDGYLAIGANHQAQFDALCDVLGRADLPQDPRFRDHRSRVEHADELRAVLEEIFAARRATDLEPLLAARQVPVSVVRTVPDIVSHPQLEERRAFLGTEVPGLEEPVRVVGPGFLTDHDQPCVGGPVPSLGQHTDQILAELGYSPAEIVELHSSGTV